LERPARSPTPIARSSYPSNFNYSRVSPIGYLAGDQRHQLARVGRLSACRSAAAALETTLLQSYDSGLPYSIAGAINLTRYTGAPTNLGYATVPNGLYYFSGRGELRTEASDPPIWHCVTACVSRRWSFFAQGDLLNAFNNAALFDPQRLGTTVSTAATSTTFLPFDPRNRADRMSARRRRPRPARHGRELPTGNELRTGVEQSRLSKSAQR